MFDYYWIEVYPNYGDDRRFKTARDINQVISEYEAMGDFVRVEDPDGNEIYRSHGLNVFLSK